MKKFYGGAMKREICFVAILSVCLLMLPVFSIYAADEGKHSVSPKKNQKKKWRVGYYQGGSYIDYQIILKSTIKGLMELGWVKKTAIPNHQDTKDLWLWMSKDLKSTYINFVSDAYYNSDWKDDVRVETKKAAIQRMSGKKDIDLMLAFGTWAGQDLVNNKHSTPTLVCSSSDPIASGIIKSADDSGYDHAHVKVFPKRYERQVQLFHDIIGFMRLGVVYEDSLEGRSYSAIDKVKNVSEERGFKIIPCHARFSEVTDAQAQNEVMACHEKLAPKVDAVYITVHRGVNIKNMQRLLAPLNKYKIPTFSQSGSNEVRYGVLFSIAQAAFKYVGKFHAQTMAKIFNGAKPRDLDQIFESPPKIAINLKTADIIGYNPPVDILGAADEIYQEIEVMK